MDIVKQKEIVSLARSANDLESKFKAQQKSKVDATIESYLSSAVKYLEDFLKGKGFAVTHDSTGLNFSGNLDDMVYVSLKHYGKYFTVDMSNQEKYKVTVETSLSFSFEDFKGSNQDDEILYYKNKINKLKDLIAKVEMQEFNFILINEINSELFSNPNKTKEIYRSFDEILTIMFS